MDNSVTFVVDGIVGAYKDADGNENAVRLRYDFNQLVEAEAVANCNLLQALGNLGRMNATQMRALVYALLRTDQPTITLKEAGDILSADSMLVTRKVTQVLGVADQEE